MAKKENVIKYRHPINFNIGFVIFLIIIIYVLFNVFSYFTKNEIAKYQVQQGTIAANHTYQGIILRDETVEYAKENGYVDYYMKDISKVSVTDVIYSIDMVGNISNEIASKTNTSQELSKESLESISKEIDDFLKIYNANQFATSYDFFNNLNSEIVYNVNSNALEDMSDKIAQAVANNTFQKFSSPEDGVIVYAVDGFEDVAIEDILSNGFDYSAYHKTHLTSNRKVTTADAVYKRINSEEWDILVPIDEKLAIELNEKSSISIRFCKDNYTTNASCSVLREKDSYYLKLSLRTGMIRYAEDRFVDIELAVKATSGLKIPVSAITSKEFFTIPKTYFTVGNEQLLVKEVVDGTDTMTLVTPTIYYETEEYYYVDSEYVQAGDILQMPDSASMYIVGTDTDSLVGVYNINKGYAVFKQINILHESEEYAIIETKTSYGISLYDHIALDADSVKEHQLITK